MCIREASLEALFFSFGLLDFLRAAPGFQFCEFLTALIELGEGPGPLNLKKAPQEFGKGVALANGLAVLDWQADEPAIDSAAHIAFPEGVDGSHEGLPA